MKDLADIPERRSCRQLLSNTGLKSLCEQKDLVIGPTDKGSGIVILDKTGYEIEMYRILNEPNTYKELPNNPTSIFKSAAKFNTEGV